MQLFPIFERVLKAERHTTFYLECGRADGPLLIFVHGWPELSISWRHQMPCFAALGFRCIAPDMRGYGRSTVYSRHEDYALAHIVRDMTELLDALRRERAVWVGHDWGSAVVWGLAGNHPERCFAVANLCVPYIAGGFTPENLLPLIDRTIYPEAEFPAGQWDYQLFYRENFAKAVAAFEANVANTVKALFRKGNPDAMDRPSRTALVRRNQSWFGGAQEAPDLPLDRDVLSEEDLSRYAAALTRNGFFGPCSWYMNGARNQAFAAEAQNGGRITMPVLFLHGAYDSTCETLRSRLAEPMRRDCADLEEVVVPSGHWMAQERPVEVNAALASWLARRLADIWPRPKPIG
ncbi:MAG TPA: alpha/beta hydrolase [Acetobacteraceae bacterium]|nr:alpha/beta hydrolase [Acetobacteraceae bacterium]